jgi:HEAT repeat protein
MTVRTMNERRLCRAPFGAAVCAVLVVVLAAASDGRQALRADDPEKTVEMLIAELRSDKTAVREKAARDLAKRGTKARAAIAPLTTALDDLEAVVRRAALVALGEMGEESAPAVEAIVKLCETDDVAENRLLAVKTLGRIGPQAGVSVKLLLYIARGGRGERGREPVQATNKIRPLVEGVPLRCEAIRSLAQIAPEDKEVRTLYVLLLRAGVDQVEQEGTPYFVVTAEAIGQAGVDTPEIVAALARGQRLTGSSSGQKKIREAAEKALRRLKEKREEN